MPESLCPCGSQLSYQQCCQPIISGSQAASSAEQLMRSRFSAFSLKEVDYLMQSWAGQKRVETERSALQQWCEQTKFIRLDIIDHYDGSHPCQAFVEFKATYLFNNKFEVLHETSEFIQAQNRWFYLDGNTAVYPLAVGRNDLCPCQSGKKSKRCCR